MYCAVFSDIDGTLLNNAHQMTDGTRQAILRLRAYHIPFVLVSARSPAGIETLRRPQGLAGPLIAFSGGLVLEEDGRVVHSQGMTMETAREILRFVREQRFDAAWCLYSAEEWMVGDDSDARVKAEEEIVGLKARAVPYPEILPDDMVIYKIMLICHPADQEEIFRRVREKFPFLSIVPSNAINLEIVPDGVGKGRGIRKLCESRGISAQHAIALGDSYNDLDMLEAVGCPVVMGNAPADIRARFARVTEDNEHDGVAAALEKLIFSKY